MNVCKELDNKNATFSPNLTDVEESAKRTYGQGVRLFAIAKRELDAPETLSLSLEENYDECKSIATILGLACEEFLKAIYIYEQRVTSTAVESIWNSIKFKRPKLDDQGNRMYSSDGRRIDIDPHELDNLIQMISPSARTMLETNLLTIPMESTERHKEITIVDILKSKGKLIAQEKMERGKYSSWLEMHKKIFVDARYGGETNHDMSLEFLFHLTQQIQAVAQFYISPLDKQNFQVSDRELMDLPDDIQKLFNYNQNLISRKLIELISKEPEKQELLLKILAHEEIIKKLTELRPNYFCLLLEKMNISEIILVSSLLQYIDKNKQNNINEFNYLKLFDINQLVWICIWLKSYTKQELDVNLIKEFEQVIGTIAESVYMTNNYKNDYKINNFIPEDELLKYNNYNINKY